MTTKLSSTGHPKPPPGGREGARDEQGLTGREREFVLHYLGAARRNATEAARLTGYGKTTSSTKSTASKIMQRPHIIAEIERLTAERNERLVVTSDDVLRELMILKVDVESHSRTNRSAPVMRTRLDVLKTIGEHVAVGAFRKLHGLSGPGGGPIETVDAAALAALSDEELDTLERARAILDRSAGGAALPDRGGDPSGEGTPPEA